MNKLRILIVCLSIMAGLSQPVGGQTLVITNGSSTISALTNTTVTMTGRCELRVTAATNPVPGCIINLNSPDAWFFLPNIRPSVATANYLGAVRVNGANAVVDGNCRVDQYAMGTVIIPHAPAFMPLTVFSGQNFLGPSAQFGLYTYYNTSAALGAMDRNISSFRLKRGYMATFAQNADGSGVSRVYVAQDDDLNVGVIQTNLDRACSFVRVFPWRWTGKKGWAGSADATGMMVDPLWSYDWDNVANSTPDTEYIPMRHDLYWDDYGNINNKQKSTQALGFNEPDQPAPQANMSVATAIANWPNLMVSGLRIGAPAISSSGVTGAGPDWLYSFMNQATNLGYRVDFIPVHFYKCNWSANQLSNYLAGIYQTTGRPLWVTEFNNGDPSCGNVTLAANASAITSYLNMLESCPFVERYAIYNWFDTSSGLRMTTTNSPGTLTPAGQIYHDRQSALAYKQTLPPGGSRGIAQFQFEGNPLDSSGFGNNGFAFGVPNYGAGHSGQAVGFDGTNNFIQLPPNLANSPAFTFAAWVNWNGGAVWQRIFDFGDDTAHYLYLTPSSSSGTLRFGINNGGGDQIIETTGLPVGQWTHVAVTLSGANAKLYTNGVLAASSGAFTIVPSNFNPNLNYLGKSQFATDPLFRGQLDEVLVTDTALTAAQIATLRTNLPPQFTNSQFTLPNVMPGQAYNASLAGAAIDPNPVNTLTYTKINGPAWLGLAANGTVVGTPGLGDVGTNYFTVRVTDFAGASAFALVIVNVNGLVNPGFEIPPTPAYSYNPSGAAWTFSAQSSANGSGVTANNSAFTTGNPNAPEGMQSAFLQGIASITQPVTGLVPGTTYNVTFAAAQRAQYQNGGETWQVRIDNAVIGNFNSPASATNYVDYPINFTATAATHTLRFVGTDIHGGDNTLLIDNVRLTFVSPPVAPAAPATLAAVSGDGQVALSWSPVPFATSYNVKRAFTSGGGYVTNTSIAGTSYTDTNVVNGTQYFYVVSAVNSGGEGTNSVEVVAQPVSTVVAPLNFSPNPDGSGLLFNWPSDHTGWRLMMNTNGIGVSNAWLAVPESSSTNQLWWLFDKVQTNVFFRLVYP